MKLSSCQLDLPEHYIAKYPAKRREQARLMVVHRSTGKIEHLYVSDLPRFLDEEYVCTLNDSKVFPARLYGSKERTGAMIEMLLLRELDAETHLWNCLVHPARKVRMTNKLYCKDGFLVGEVIDNTTSSERIIRFLLEEGQSLYDILEEIGEAPLPSALQRKAEPIDRERYQTVYAKRWGSTLVSDGGIHLTPYILKQLELQDVSMPVITAHSSLNMLRSLAIQDLSRHTLHSEYFEISEKAAHSMNMSMARKKKVCAVGVCTLKALESAIGGERKVRSMKGWTNKFIYPPYEPSIVDALLTNLHSPNTAPFINTLAFGGHELMMQAYTTAVEEGYRFLVYGDALLIL